MYLNFRIYEGMRYLWVWFLLICDRTIARWWRGYSLDNTQYRGICGTRYGRFLRQWSQGSNWCLRWWISSLSPPRMTSFNAGLNSNLFLGEFAIFFVRRAGCCHLWSGWFEILEARRIWYLAFRISQWIFAHLEMHHDVRWFADNAYKRRTEKVFDLFDWLTSPAAWRYRLIFSFSAS